MLAVSTSLGSISAQTGIPVNADGSYVVANDDGAPIASGAGDDIVYGDINTGGGGGEILGDPNAVYSPMVPDNPGPDGGVPVMPGAGDGLIGGVPILPVPAAPDATTQTTTESRQHGRHRHGECPGRCRRAGRIRPRCHGHGGGRRRVLLAIRDLVRRSDRLRKPRRDGGGSGAGARGRPQLRWDRLRGVDGLTGDRRPHPQPPLPCAGRGGFVVVPDRVFSATMHVIRDAGHAPVDSAHALQEGVLDGARGPRFDDRLRAVLDRPGAGGTCRGRISRLRDRRGQGLVRAYRSRHGDGSRRSTASRASWRISV